MKGPANSRVIGLMNRFSQESVKYELESKQRVKREVVVSYGDRKDVTTQIVDVRAL